MACCNRGRAVLKERLREKKRRLMLYYEREQELMKKAKQYNIGSRGLTRYDTPLSDIRAAIKDLEKEIDELEAALCGKGPRRAVAVVQRDW